MKAKKLITIKGWALLSLFTVMILSIVMAIGFGATPVNAAEIETHEVIGASVRLPDDNVGTSIRFTYVINTNSVGLSKVKEMGVVVKVKDEINPTFDYSGNSGEVVKYIENGAPTGNKYNICSFNGDSYVLDEKGTFAVVHVYLYNVPADSIHKELSCVGFYSLDGKNYSYTSVVDKSIAYVVKAALDSGVYEEVESTLTAVLESATDHEGGTATLREQVTCTVCGFEFGKIDKKGVHEFAVSETSTDFISSGVCNYVLVVPENATEYETLAANEFNELFNMATGLTLSVINDTGLSHNSNNKFISIGNTSLFTSSNLTVDFNELGDDGVRILTKDKTVYLLGGATYGAVYSVYDFMNLYFNFEAYSNELIVIDKNVTDAKLLDFNVTNTPDYPVRAKFYEIGRYDSNDAMRMRFTNNRELLPIHKELGNKNSANSRYSSHNAAYYLPYETYYESHYKWFSNKGNSTNYQLCYTAHGDEEELQLMLEECAKKIEQSLIWYTPEEYPAYNVVNLNMMDNRYVCQCSKCLEVFEKYDDCNSAAVIMFMNRLAKMVDEWMEQPENAAYKRDLKYIFFAYLDLEKCPARYNEVTGKYEPIDENVTFYENVGVYLAMLDKFDYQVSVYHYINKEGREIVQSWGDVADYIWYWLYPSGYSESTMYFMNTFNFLEEGLLYIASEGNPTLIFMENQRCGLNWESLKYYVETKLLWNSSLNMEDIIDEWFIANFGEAASLMKEVFNDMRSYYNDLIVREDLIVLRSGLAVKLNKPEYWDINALKDWLNRMDNAKSIAETYYKATDTERYQQIIDSIERQCISPVCALLELHFDSLTEKEIISYQMRLRKDLNTFDNLNAKWDERIYNSILTLINKELYSEVGVDANAWFK